MSHRLPGAFPRRHGALARPVNLSPRIRRGRIPPPADWCILRRDGREKGFGLRESGHETAAGLGTSIDATLLIALFVLLAVVLPVLAVVASSRIRRLEMARRAAPAPRKPEPQPRLAAVEQKLAAVERRLAAIEGRLGAEPGREAEIPAPIPFPEPAAALEMPQEPVAAAPAPVAARPRADIESVVALRWLVYVGIIALLFALAFFIKYSFDNHWVGSRGRVAVGLTVGALLVLWTDRLLKRGYGYFSESIAGLGAAVLYFSLWGSWHYFRLLPLSGTLAGMILVTGAMVTIALGRNSQRLAFLALAGGYVTPFLLRTAHDPEITLFTYIAVLSAGTLALERVRRWAWVPPLSLLVFETYYWVWYIAFYDPLKLERTLGFATLLFLLFAVLPTLRALRMGHLTIGDYLVVSANLAGYLVALRMLLWPDRRWLLAAAFFALAVAHRQVWRALPQPRAGQTRLTRRFYATLALLCLSLAIPARLDHAWLTIAWAMEGAVVVWSGIRMESPWLRAAGALLLSMGGVRLLFLPLPAPHFLWNERFLAFAAVVASLAFSAAIALRAAARLEHFERHAVSVLLVAVNAYSLMAMSLEVWDVLGRLQTPGMESWPAQQMGLSVLWTLYAAGLVLVGMARKSALLRWLALTLFALVVSKVFLYDLSSLERFYRILSFLVLGILLLVVSFLYQRRAGGQKTKRETEEHP
jgi:uncharacterized membrane protein